MEQTIAALVAKVRGGDLEAFARLMALFRSRFDRYAFRMLGSREEAEEAVQDTFLRAYRAIQSCREPARFGGWAFAILVNRCRTLQRRMLRQEHRRSAADPDDLISVPHPEGVTAWHEEIDRALAVLPPPQREAFLLKHVEGLSYEEIARMSGAGVPALKMRVMRACEALRRELEGALYG